MKYDLEAFQQHWPDMFRKVVCGFSLPEGWGPLVWKLCEQLEPNQVNIKVDQVKEKFGGLRFYVSFADVSQEIYDSVNRIVSEFEAFSYLVCEQCGTTVDVDTRGSSENGHGWITTQCESCRAARKLVRWEDR